MKETDATQQHDVDNDGHWWALEQKISDFLDDENVVVENVGDAKYTHFGPITSHRKNLTTGQQLENQQPAENYNWQINNSNKDQNS